MNKKIAGLLALLFYITTSFAQSKLTDAHILGHVIDKATGEHLPYVGVMLKGTTLGMTTDATGHFLMKNVPVGEHTLVATFVGYERMEQTVKVVANRTVEVEFELQPVALELSGVVVTGSRNETNRKESATIVNVLSTRAFETTSSTSVSDVLSFQPGLRVEMSCYNCGAPELRINGLSGQYSQILLDSRPIFSSLAGVYGLEQLPVGMIERVEITRGGGSALFGSSAIGGVVNIITKEPLRNSFTISNNTGVFGKGKTSVNTALNGSFVTDDHKTGVYLFAVTNNRDAYDRDDDGFSEAPKLRSETLGFRGYHNISDYSKITLEYHRIAEFRRGGDQVDRPAHEAEIAEQTTHSINGGGLKYELFSSDYKHQLNVYGSAQSVSRDSYYGTGKDPDAYGHSDDFTLVAGTQYTYRTNHFLFLPSQFTAGVEYSGNSLDDKAPAYERHIKQNTECFGGYFQNEWKDERVSLLLGGRLDKHNLMSSVIFSPRVSARYALGDNATIRASYSSGYRAPQAFDEDLHIAAVGGDVALIQLDPNLKPEYSHSFNASIDLNKKLGNVETNFLIDGFYTDLQNVFVLEERERADGHLILERTNAKGAAVRGVNFDLTLGLSAKFVANAGFTVQRSTYKEAQEWSPNVEASTRMHRSPDHYGYLALDYTPMKKLTISVTGNYTGSMIVPHFEGFAAEDSETETPSFFDAGLKLAYDFHLSKLLKMQVSVGMKNIFDQYQKDLDQGDLRDAGYIYGPSLPRMVHFGVKLSM